jgi:hypothetical protein
MEILINVLIVIGIVALIGLLGILTGCFISVGNGDRR